MKLPRLALVVFLFIFTTDVFAQTRWNMHVALPESNFHTEGVLKFAELVGEKTNGGLDIVVQSGGALGFGGQEMLRVVSKGGGYLAGVLMVGTAALIALFPGIVMFLPG